MPKLSCCSFHLVLSKCYRATTKSELLLCLRKSSFWLYMSLLKTSKILTLINTLKHSCCSYTCWGNIILSNSSLIISLINRWLTTRISNNHFAFIKNIVEPIVLGQILLFRYLFNFFIVEWMFAVCCNYCLFEIRMIEIRSGVITCWCRYFFWTISFLRFSSLSL